MLQSLLLVMFLLGTRLSWNDILDHGGLKVGEPTRAANGVVRLPVDCDLSGTRTISVQPIEYNSALAVKKLHVKVNDHKVYLWIVATLKNNKYKSSSCTDVELGKLKKGEYEIYYETVPGPAKLVNRVWVK